MKAKVVPEEADMTGEMPEDMYTADDMVLIKREVEVKEVDVTDASGQEARLIIYKGILEQPIWYQEFGRAGYLSNE